MFTGLVECIGTIKSVAKQSSDIYRIDIHAPSIAGNVKNGESISVAGACLTAVESETESFGAHMMMETVRSTRLGSLKAGDRVNLERALRLGDRLDGHMVSGHVDDVGVVRRLEVFGDTRKLWISAPESIGWGIAAKGSIAVDGVSLTVIDSREEQFSVGLIPTTLRDTTLGLLSADDSVNLEMDIIMRYVARLAQGSGYSSLMNGSTPITWGKLQEYGWT